MSVRVPEEMLPLPKASPRVAAIVVAWNSEAVLGRCLQALAAQTTPFAKVVVVDNDPAGSQAQPEWDGAGEFLFMRPGKNLGFAGGNNKALALCEGCDWVALVNPDAFLAADWLSCMLEAAGRYPDRGSFASRLVMDGAPFTLDGVGDAMHVSGLAWRLGHGRPCSDKGWSEGEVFSACAAAALYKYAALQEVQGFDESFFCYFEDVDLGFRLRLAGYPCWYVPAAVARHIGSASTGGARSAFAVYHGHRNLVWCYVKNMPLPLFWLFLPFHVLMNVATVLLFLWRGQGGNIMRAKRDALTGLPAAWRKRRQVQSERKASCMQILKSFDVWFVSRMERGKR